MLFDLSSKSVEETTLLFFKGIFSELVDITIAVSVILITVFLIIKCLDIFLGEKHDKTVLILKKILNKRIIKNKDNCRFELIIEIQNTKKSIFVSKEVFFATHENKIKIRYIEGKFSKNIYFLKTAWEIMLFFVYYESFSSKNCSLKSDLQKR